MRNLLSLLHKYHYFIVFIALQVICVLLMLKNRTYQSTAIFNSSNAVSSNLYSAVANSKEYFGLKEENKKLAEENAMLRNLMKSSYDILNNSEPVFIKNDSLFRKKYNYHAAKVINSTSNLEKNYLTLNIGSNQGVVKDQAVINSEGVVGVIKDVSANFSTATSLLHKEQKIICKVKKDGSYGPLSWDGSDYRYATLTDIATHVRLVIGDTICTSAISDYFPEGINVGVVEKFERKQGDAFYTVKVRLKTDFKKLNYVYVIGNNYRAEKDSLEKLLSNPEKIK